MQINKSTLIVGPQPSSCAEPHNFNLMVEIKIFRADFLIAQKSPNRPQPIIKKSDPYLSHWIQPNQLFHWSGNWHTVTELIQVPVFKASGTSRFEMEES